MLALLAILQFFFFRMQKETHNHCQIPFVLLYGNKDIYQQEKELNEKKNKFQRDLKALQRKFGLFKKKNRSKLLLGDVQFSEGSYDLLSLFIVLFYNNRDRDCERK